MFSYSLTSDTWARVISSTCPGVCLELSVVAEGVGDDGEDAKKLGERMLMVNTASAGATISCVSLGVRVSASAKAHFF